MQQRRVGPVQPHVRVAKAHVELQGQPGVNPGPDQVPEQDRIGDARRRAAIDGPQPVPGRLADLGHCRPGGVEVQAVAIGGDGLQADRVLDRRCQRLGEPRREVPGPRVLARHPVGDRLEPDHLARRRPAGLGHLLWGQHLAGLVAGIEQPRVHARGPQKPPADLAGSEVGAALQVPAGGHGRFQVQQRRAPAADRESQRAVEHRRSRRGRPRRLGEQGLDPGAVERGGDHAMAVVIDERQPVSRHRGPPPPRLRGPWCRPLCPR